MTKGQKRMRKENELEAMMFAFDLGMAFFAGIIQAAEHRQEILKALQEKKEEVVTHDPNPASQADL